MELSNGKRPQERLCILSLTGYLDALRAEEKLLTPVVAMISDHEREVRAAIDPIKGLARDTRKKIKRGLRKLYQQMKQVMKPPNYDDRLPEDVQ